MSDYIYNHVKFKSATIIPLVSKYISCTDLSSILPSQQFNHPPLCHCSWLFDRLSFGASLNCNNSSCLSLKVHFELLLKFFISSKTRFLLHSISMVFRSDSQRWVSLVRKTTTVRSKRFWEASEMASLFMTATSTITAGNI